MNANCYFCGCPVDPLARQTWRRVTGWERKAIGPARRGGSDIALRQQVDEFACGGCIKLQQSGIPIGQAQMFDGTGVGR